MHAYRPDRYIAGGIAPKLLGRIRDVFPRVFLDDPVNRVLLEEFPLFLVTDPDLGLKGAKVRAFREL